MTHGVATYPLDWPPGWPRTEEWARIRARFSRDRTALSVWQGVDRVVKELGRMGVRQDDVIVSTNLRTRNDGWPRSDQPEPRDAGVAVYWQDGKDARRVIAIDIYDKVAGNLGAIAATLDAMRAIERHGGARILERAFTGFAALPNPDRPSTWRDVFGFAGDERVTINAVEFRYRELAQTAHPDRGGSHEGMARLNKARDEAREALGA